MSKVKANDKFRFPLELDLSAYLPPEAQDGAVYDLSAILIHKGSSASHGHYGVKPDTDALPQGHPAVMACRLVRAWSAEHEGKAVRDALRIRI